MKSILWFLLVPHTGTTVYRYLYVLPTEFLYGTINGIVQLLFSVVNFIHRFLIVPLPGTSVRRTMYRTAIEKKQWKKTVQPELTSRWLKKVRSSGISLIVVLPFCEHMWPIILENHEIGRSLVENLNRTSECAPME